MKNAEITARFLAATDAKTKAEVLRNIAMRYGISEEEAFAEVTHEAAEHLLDYLTGPARAAAHALMQRHGLAA